MDTAPPYKWAAVLVSDCGLPTQCVSLDIDEEMAKSYFATILIDP